MWPFALKYRIGALFVLAILFARELYLRNEIELYIEDPAHNSTTVRMSRREANRLDQFFRKLIIKEPFAYTLAGCKPISICSFQNHFHLSLSGFSFVLGYRTWEKIQHNFSNPNILWWTEENMWSEGKTLIVITDIEQTTRAIEQNSHYFTQNAQEDESILLNTRPFFKEALHDHAALIGILLGYGKKNSVLYYDRLQDYCDWPLEKKLDHSECLPSVWENRTIQKQAFRLFLKSWTFRTWTIEDILLPSFVGDPDSEESKQLKQEYLATREKLIQYYKNRNFLEATLSLYQYGAQMLNCTK